MGWEGGRGGGSGIIIIAEKWLKISFLTVFLSVLIIFLVILRRATRSYIFFCNSSTAFPRSQTISNGPSQKSVLTSTLLSTNTKIFLSSCFNDTFGTGYELQIYIFLCYWGHVIFFPGGGTQCFLLRSRRGGGVTFF